MNPSGAARSLPTAISAGRLGRLDALVDLFALREDLPGGEPSLVELLQLLESTERTGDRRGRVPDGAGRPHRLAAQGPRHADRRLRPARSRATGATAGLCASLVDAFALIGRPGVSAAQADGWATATIGATQAEELRLAAKSKHDEERWPAIARALRDPVRDKQRAALVAYLIASDANYADEEDLFNDLLIDVEM